MEKQGRFSESDYNKNADNGQQFANIILDTDVPDSSTIAAYADAYLRSQYSSYSFFEKGCNDGYLSTTTNYCYIIYKAMLSYGDLKLYVLQVWYEINDNEAILFTKGALSLEAYRN